MVLDDNQEEVVEPITSFNRESTATELGRLSDRIDLDAAVERTTVDM